jgi:hypothetical protein
VREKGRGCVENLSRQPELQEWDRQPEHVIIIRKPFDPITAQPGVPLELLVAGGMFSDAQMDVEAVLTSVADELVIELVGALVGKVTGVAPPDGSIDIVVVLEAAEVRDDLLLIFDQEQQGRRAGQESLKERQREMVGVVTFHLVRVNAIDIADELAVGPADDPDLVGEFSAFPQAVEEGRPVFFESFFVGGFMENGVFHEGRAGSQVVELGRDAEMGDFLPLEFPTKIAGVIADRDVLVFKGVNDLAVNGPFL